MEEFEAREKQKMAQLEEEIRRAEQEKHEEIRGKLKRAGKRDKIQ
jgi:dynein intermediate chain